MYLGCFVYVFLNLIVVKQLLVEFTVIGALFGSECHRRYLFFSFIQRFSTLKLLSDKAIITFPYIIVKHKYKTVPNSLVEYGEFPV